ncbi:MAG: precorrin-6A reductase [Anaerotignaceae bacterium]
MNKVIVFAGTEEGRKICEFLANKVELTACTATDYGTQCLAGIGANVLEGRLTKEEMEEIIKGFDLVIDATHPYAKVVSQNIKEACTFVDKEYLRVIREEIKCENVLNFNNINDVCSYLNENEGNILVTTGSKELLPYTKIKDFQKRVYVRVLPTESSLKECIEKGFKGSNIICMQGPFCEEINIGTIKQVKAKFVVTKETGKTGGYEEKVNAATKCGAKTLVIGRPIKEEGLTLNACISYLESIINNQKVFPLFFNLNGKEITIFGGGTIAKRRAETLLKFGCNITVIAPEIKIENVTRINKAFEKTDIKNQFFVIAATNDKKVNEEIYYTCKEKNIFVNVVDDKNKCDFFFPAIFESETLIGGIVSKQGTNHKEVKEVAEKIRGIFHTF